MEEHGKQLGASNEHIKKCCYDTEKDSLVFLKQK